MKTIEIPFEVGERVYFWDYKNSRVEQSYVKSILVTWKAKDPQLRYNLMTEDPEILYIGTTLPI